MYDIIDNEIYSDSLFYFDYYITGGPITTILKATEGRGQYNQRHDSRYDSRTQGTVHFWLSPRIPTAKLKIPGKAFLNPNHELLLHSSYSF